MSRAFEMGIESGKSSDVDDNPKGRAMIGIESSQLESLGDHSSAYLDGIPFAGVAYETDLRGNLTGETEYKDGLEDGRGTEWWSNGTKRSEGEYRSGLPVGTYRLWFSDGQLAEETEYDDSGDPRSIRKWDEDGNLISEKTFS